MAFRLGLDCVRLNGERQPLAFPIRAKVGDIVEIGGWAIDGRTSRGVEGLVARVQPGRDFVVRTRIARPELAPTLGAAAADCGFLASIPTAGLRPVQHELFLVVSADSGTQWSSQGIGLHLRSADGISLENRQIVCATAMKSGGRHVAAVLADYYGISNPIWGAAFPSVASDAEHVLSEELMRPALDRQFVLCNHLLGRGVNLNAIAYWGFRPVVTWRNLGDVTVSLDDHTRIEPGVWQNTYTFLAERESYLAMPAQRRYQFQIRNAIPWYFSFYLSWRLARAPLFMRYEWMATDELGYFRYLIERIDGAVDEARLRAIVMAGPTERSGLNVGRVGRSATLLSEESQEMLEACITEHPADVRELLYELPWYVAKYGAPTLVSPSRDEVYLIAENTKRRASSHWLRTHTVDPATIVAVAPGDLAGYAAGTDLF